MQRRSFVKAFMVACTSFQLLPHNLFAALMTTRSNFKLIYSSATRKNEFFKFLKNVFNLFPENDLHKLIADTTASKGDDDLIYREVQSKLDEITPFFSTIRYSLPALMKQKDEMARQALVLLGKGGTYDGYLEIGSSGRYLDYLEEKINIKGERYYADGKEPGYAVTEMVDRGQIKIGAKYIPFVDYKTRYTDVVPAASLDLVTVYIGFHHCPLELRTPYISSIRDTMRVGGKLILRDHDCDTEEQKVLVALAHDVFNMGTQESWEYNSREVRNFYSLKFICDFIEQVGFKFDKRTLLQEGDPTKNALMLFTKI
ncbi:MAG: dehydrogenase [Cyclobacteriaceae bacterium]|nr:dehydrogenase [Cyclobacteriaceae bacterium]